MGRIFDIGLRGFLPASLIELCRVRDLTPYLGQEIEAKILELDKNRNNVVLSRRALFEQTHSESRTMFISACAKSAVASPCWRQSSRTATIAMWSSRDATR